MRAVYHVLNKIVIVNLIYKVFCMQGGEKADGKVVQEMTPALVSQRKSSK